MTKDDVQALADEVLTPILGPVGFAFSDVVEREDSVGDDALYVTVHMTPEAEFVPGFRYSDALMAMQDALVERGGGTVRVSQIRFSRRSPSGCRR